MVNTRNARSADRVAILQWTARIGAITADALAHRQHSTLASARGRLMAAERSGLLRRSRPLTGQPALYTLTRAGLRASGERGLDPCQISSANALHAIECARVAAALERSYPDHRVIGERELRRDERQCGAALASASLRAGPRGIPVLHRPDLVLCPNGAGEALPVAVEVELTIKAAPRLFGICRAWARCDRVAGAIYLAPPHVRGALERAIHKASAHDRIVVVPLDAVDGSWVSESGVGEKHPR